MPTLREALQKAGLVSKKQLKSTEEVKTNYNRKLQRYKSWAGNAYKNRFGDPALFEIWAKSKQLPQDHMKKCCLCGKPIFEIIPWTTPKGRTFRVCPECYVDGRNRHDSLFHDLEAKLMENSGASHPQSQRNLQLLEGREEASRNTGNL